jgi:ribonuclease BN (tRNA processing enzyme)
MEERKDHGRVRVVFLGTGDAFGSGGRNQSSYLIETEASSFLLDCGATALLSLKRFGADPSRVHSMIVSHLHGDHIAGLPFFFLEWLYQARRETQVVIAGPRGIQEKAEGLYALMYGSAKLGQIRSLVQYVNLEPEQLASFEQVEVFPFRVPHQADAVSLALKVWVSGKTILYSGDSPWTEALAHQSAGTDLFICECSYYRPQEGNHLSLQEILMHRQDLRSRKIVLSHLGAEVLSHAKEIPFDWAGDGMIVDI